MCGINGIYAYHPNSRTVDPHELSITRDAMYSRGPDDHDNWFSDDLRVGLGHRRLSIIDLSELGKQPMSTRDGRYHIVFNGEIYNYLELREELLGRGCVLHSHSDTEVLLHLYGLEGNAMLHRLRGMFAFAIWDNVEQTLFLARDPYGIKPLYYADDGRSFRFASQVKALLKGGAISNQLEPSGIVGFLLTGSVPEPFTIFSAIHSLPAGSYLYVNAEGASSPQRYWDLGRVIESSIKAAAAIPSGEEQEYFRASLVDSIKAHSVADVPVGAFLSAGLDSSTIVGLASEYSEQPIRTFTLAFEEFKGRVYDESELAQAIARQFGTRHQCLHVSARDVIDDIPRFLDAMDQPTVDGLNVWFVSKAATQAGLKVSLSGLGGDELLGGYASFQEIPQLVSKYGRLSKLPLLGDIYQWILSNCIAPYSKLSSRHSGLLKLTGNYSDAYSLVRSVYLPWELDLVLDSDFARAGLGQLRAMADHDNDARLSNEFGELVLLESTRYMRNQLLRDSDWIGMAHSLEIRTPLVDRALTEAVVGLACTGRLGAGKSALPRSLHQPLPDEVINRPKTGFTYPIWKWLRHLERLNSWKNIKALCKPSLNDNCRWAYTLLSLDENTVGILRKA